MKSILLATLVELKALIEMAWRKSRLVRICAKFTPVMKILTTLSFLCLQTGYLWAWNFMITKRWKNGLVGDEIYMRRFLHNFRRFCLNCENRLSIFWKQYQEEIFPKSNCWFVLRSFPKLVFFVKFYLSKKKQSFQI